MLANERGEMRAPPILCKRLKLCFQDENITIQHTYFLKKISAHLHCNRNYLWFSAFILVQIVCRWKSKDERWKVIEQRARGKLKMESLSILQIHDIAKRNRLYFYKSVFRILLRWDNYGILRRYRWHLYLKKSRRLQVSRVKRKRETLSSVIFALYSIICHPSAHL